MTTEFRIARIGDSSIGYCSIDEATLSGQISSSSNNTVRSNGILVAVIGDPVLGSGGHIGTIVNGRTTVKVEGILAAKIDSAFSGIYTGTIIGASPDVG